MLTEAKRQAVRRKIDLFLEHLVDGKADSVKSYLYDVIDTVLDETEELQRHKAESSDVRELIIEMREGFRRMDERFEQMDKRFSELIHYMDRRFEQVDKRFEELIHYVDRRFEQVDKRFEDMQHNFSRLQWLIGIGFVVLSLLTTWLGTRQPPIDETKLQKSLTEAVRQGFREAVTELKLLPIGR